MRTPAPAHDWSRSVLPESTSRVATLLTAVRDGATEHAGVIATAYADADRVASLDPFAMVDAAAAAAVTVMSSDTADKQGPGLRELTSPATLRAWVAAARDAHMLVALAGKLTADDFGLMNDAGADIVGVRRRVRRRPHRVFRRSASASLRLLFVAQHAHLCLALPQRI